MNLATLGTSFVGTRHISCWKTNLILLLHRVIEFRLDYTRANYGALKIVSCLVLGKAYEDL